MKNKIFRNINLRKGELIATISVDLTPTIFAINFSMMDLVEGEANSV